MSGAGLLALGMLALVLGGVLALELRGSPASSLDGLPALPGMAGNARPPAAPAAGPAADRAAQVATILARPLFEPTRRPPAAAQAAPPTAPPTTMPRVTGILVSASDRSAIFAAPDGGPAVIAHEGGRVGAFTVQSIAAGQVTLLGPGGPVLLRPSFDTSPRPPRAAAASPPAPVSPTAPAFPGLPQGPLGRFGLPALPGLPAMPALPPPPPAGGIPGPTPAGEPALGVASEAGTLQAPLPAPFAGAPAASGPAEQKTPQ